MSKKKNPKYEIKLAVFTYNNGNIAQAKLDLIPPEPKTLNGPKP